MKLTAAALALSLLPRSVHASKSDKGCIEVSSRQALQVLLSDSERTEYRLCPFVFQGDSCNLEDFEFGNDIQGTKKLVCTGKDKDSCVYDCPGIHFHVESLASFTLNGNGWTLSGANVSSVDVKSGADLFFYGVSFKNNISVNENGGSSIFYRDGGGKVVIDGSRFIENLGGSQVFIANAEVQIASSSFLRNKSGETGAGASALAVFEGSLLVQNSLFQENESARGIVGVAGDDSVGIICSSTFVDNITMKNENDFLGGEGGAITAFNTEIIVSGSVFRNNVAIDSNGSAIYSAIVPDLGISTTVHKCSQDPNIFENNFEARGFECNGVFQGIFDTDFVGPELFHGICDSMCDLSSLDPVPQQCLTPKKSGKSTKGSSKSMSSTKSNKSSKSSKSDGAKSTETLQESIILEGTTFTNMIELYEKVFGLKRNDVRF